MIPLPEGLEPFVRIVTPANALSAGAPDSNKNPSRSSRLCGSIFFVFENVVSREKDSIGAPGKTTPFNIEPGNHAGKIPFEILCTQVSVKAGI